MAEGEEVDLGDDLEFVELFALEFDEEEVGLLVDGVERCFDIAGRVGKLGIFQG